LVADARAFARPPRSKGCEEELSTTVELSVPAFLEEAEEHESIDEAALEAFALEHDLDEEDLAELRAELEAIHERLDFLERALVAARGGSSAALPPRAGEGPSSRVATPA